MGKYVIDGQTLTEIADSMRKGRGVIGKIPTNGFAEGIAAIGNGLSGLMERSITEIEFPHGTGKIGNYAFGYCTKLTSVTIPESVTYIGSGAFRECKTLTSVTVLGCLTTLGSLAFRDCSSCLKYDFLRHTKIPTLQENAFSGINTNAKIRVPDYLYDEWIAATNWVNWSSYIIPVSTVNINGKQYGVDYGEDEGTTWEQWINSEYNDGNFYIFGEDYGVIRDHRNDDFEATMYNVLLYISPEYDYITQRPNDKIINCAVNGGSYVLL